MWSSSELLQIFDDYEFKDSDLSPTQKSILLAIAKFANNETRESHPSIERICRITGYKPSGVKKNIKDLHKKLIITVQKRFDPSGDPTSNSYKIDIHRLQGVGHVVHHPGHHVTQVVHQVTGGGSPRDPGVGHVVDPNYKALTNQGTKKSFCEEPKIEDQNQDQKKHNKDFYDNEKKHDFAESMNKMASEQKHIDDHEKNKCTPMPENLRQLFRRERIQELFSEADEAQKKKSQEALEMLGNKLGLTDKLNH